MFHIIQEKPVRLLPDNNSQVRFGKSYLTISCTPAIGGAGVDLQRVRGFLGGNPLTLCFSCIP